MACQMLYRIVRLLVVVLCILLLFLGFVKIFRKTSAEQAEEIQSIENHTPKATIEALVQAYQNQNDSLLGQCYGAWNLHGDSVTFEKTFYAVVDAETAEVKEIEILLENSGYVYTGVRIDFVQKDGSVLPFYEYYLLKGNEEKGYQAVPADAYPEWISAKIQEQENEWRASEAYLAYEQAEDMYAKQHLGYADAFYQKLLLQLEGMPEDMQNNVQMTCVIFGMAAIEMTILLVASSIVERYHKKKYAPKRRKYKRRQSQLE